MYPGFEHPGLEWLLYKFLRNPAIERKCKEDVDLVNVNVYTTKEVKNDSYQQFNQQQQKKSINHSIEGHFLIGSLHTHSHC